MAKYDLTQNADGQWVDADGRKLLAKGYFHGWVEGTPTAVMQVWTGDEYDSEEVWNLFPEAVPSGTVEGSYLRMFEDCSTLELYAPVWTAEEIAEINEKAAEWGRMIGSFFEDDEKPE